MFAIALSTIFVISPVIIIIAIGHLARKRNWISESGVDSLSKLVYYIGLPALIIDEVSRTDISTFLNLKGPLVLIATTIVIGSIGYITANLKRLRAKEKGVWAMASFRSNMAFIGIPITLNALGQEGLYYASLLLAAGAPLYNILSIIFLIIADKDENNINSKRKLYLFILKAVFTNPLTLGTIIGVGLSFIRPDSFPVLDVTLGTLKKIPLPLALIAIGGKLNFSINRELFPKVLIPVLYKLVLSPLVGVIILSFFKVSGPDFVSTIVFLGAPTAILSYIVAGEMKADKELTLNIILITTMLSVISYILMLFLLGVFGIWSYETVAQIR